MQIKILNGTLAMNSYGGRKARQALVRYTSAS